MLLGEALTLATLVQSLLKADGRLIVQAQGAGLVSLLVTEVSDGGALRGYARLAEGAAEKLASANRIAPSELLGRRQSGDDTGARRRSAGVSRRGAA